MTEKTSETECVIWNPLTPGVPEVTLRPMKDRNEEPVPPYLYPIKVVRVAQIERPMQQEIMRILTDDNAGSGHEVRAALWLEEELGGACSKADCIAVVRDVRKAYQSARTVEEKKIVVRLSSNFWVDENTLKILKEVPGVYRLDAPGEMKRFFDTSVKMPSKEAIKAMESKLNYDDFTKETPKRALDGGSLVAVDSKPVPRPSDVSGPMPSKDSKGRRRL